MSRRNPRASGPKQAPRPGPGASAGSPPPYPRASTRKRPEADPDVEFAAWLGERLRRAALGATAALLTARAFWPSEPDLRADAGGGLVWVFALLIVAGLAVASALVGGVLRLRWSWADVGVVALSALAALSAAHALDYRPAVNLAFEWAGFGVAYLLVRNLPRARGESSALAGALVATAVAVAVYGLYQVKVELPELQRKFLANPAQALAVVGITPGTHAEAAFRDRLFGSNEPFSTFGLANSLAGFLVGPLVVMIALGWTNLTGRGGGKGERSKLVMLLLALPPFLATLICLVLTKSRSAWVGLAVAALVLAWRERRRARPRTLALAAAGAVLVVGAIVAAGLATGRLDREVFTQSGKSFRYRREYWVGAWGAITESRRSFWTGYGPGNFLAPYLRHKLPQSSEEIIDPHDLVLEAWATAGLGAALALGLAVAAGLWDCLGPPRKPETIEDADIDGAPPLPSSSTSKRPPEDPTAPPVSASWLVGCAGLGWVVVALLGRIDVIVEFERWMILGVSWVLAVGCGVALWRRRPPDSAALGAGALALVVNLTAAGGIGIATVSLALWTMLALGLNLRADRPCGRPRVEGGRAPAFALAACWAALVGTFVGQVTPYWKCEAEMARAEEALTARRPDPDRAEAAYNRALAADKYSARPWLALAALDYRVWKERGARYDDKRWQKVPIEMGMAVNRPRTPNSWSRHSERARMTSLILKEIGASMKPREVLRYRGDVVHASRTAAQLYPTNASLRAWLAEASADIGMIPDALKEGNEALRLDSATPHDDKKLQPEVRQWLRAKLPEWEKAAAAGAGPKPR